MVSDPQLWAGAAIGVAGTVVVAFALVAAADSRFVTRREYDATLKGIQGQLERIERAVDHATVD